MQPKIQTYKMLTTTAISYANGKPHIGHLYELILADFLARKNNTLLQTGTDEHGKKIEDTAKAHDETPFDFCSRHAVLFRSLADRVQVNYARFIRTTDADHIAFVQKCILRSQEKGDIYKSTFEGWYNVREECFVSDNDAKLTEYKDPVSGVPYEKLSEPAYFFRLSKYQDVILKHLANMDIQPANVLTSLKERLEEIKDICISRSTFTWGIPFPTDPAHVVYVWFDALLNYATGGLSLGKAKGHHIIGKDILWFHTAIYIGILYSCDILSAFTPEKLTVHGFVVDEKGVKMSKSLGNVVDVEYLLSKYPVDAIRFYFLTIPLTSDLRFSEKDLVASYNNILLKQFGNLFQRLFTLLQPVEKEVNSLLEISPFTLKTPVSIPDDPSAYFHELQSLLARANLFIQDSKPWTLAGEEKYTVLHKALLYLLDAIHLLTPIIPEKCKELLSYLGWDGSQLHLSPDKPKAFRLIV